MKEMSVIMCSYKPDTSIIEQIESINNSALGKADVKIFIFDDSPEINVLSEIVAKCEFENVTILNGSRRGGACHNFMSSLSKVDADWVFLSDQDDVWELNKVSEYLKVITKVGDDDAHIIFSDASLIDESGEVIFDSFYNYQNLSHDVLNSDDVLFKNCVQGATLCLNKKFIELLRDSLKEEDVSDLAMHDWWIAILARYCGKWTFIDKSLLRYRQHANNLVGAKKKTNIVSTFLQNPFDFYKKIKILRAQYKAWLRVSKRLGSRSSFTHNTMRLSFLSRCKLIAIKLIL